MIQFRMGAMDLLLWESLLILDIVGAQIEEELVLARKDTTSHTSKVTSEEELILAR